MSRTELIKLNIIHSSLNVRQCNYTGLNYFFDVDPALDRFYSKAATKSYSQTHFKTEKLKECSIQMFQKNRSAIS